MTPRKPPAPKPPKKRMVGMQLTEAEIAALAEEFPGLAIGGAVALVLRKFLRDRAPSEDPAARRAPRARPDSRKS